MSSIKGEAIRATESDSGYVYTRFMVKVIIHVGLKNTVFCAVFTAVSMIDIYQRNYLLGIA
jgi:hypothetical protein